MIRPIIVGGVALACGCQSAPKPPPGPAPDQRFDSRDGIAWHVTDGRTVFDGPERSLPVAVIAEVLKGSAADDAGPVLPDEVEFTVTSFRQTVRDPTYSGPGEYRSVLASSEPVISPSSGSSGGDALLALLGLVEMFNIGRHATLNAWAAAENARAVGDAGANCRLAGTAVLKWADGTRATVRVDGYGSVLRAGEKERWGIAIDAAQREAARAAWAQVWQAIRTRPGNEPQTAPPTPAARSGPPPAPDHPAGQGDHPDRRLTVLGEPSAFPRVAEQADQATKVLTGAGTDVPVRPPPGPAPQDPPAGADGRRVPVP